MTIFITNPKERARFMRFALVGVIGACVDFGTYSLLHDLLGVQAVIASVFSFIAAVTSNFIWNRFWTYPDSRSKAIPQQLLQFAIVSGIGLTIRTPIFALLVKPMTSLFNNLPDLPIVLPSFVGGDKVALAMAVLIVMFWNFFINRFWTYSDVDQHKPAKIASFQRNRG